MIPIAYHDSYYCPQATQLTSTRKQKEVYELALSRGIIHTDAVLAVPRAEPAEIELGHAPHYVHAVQTGVPRALAESANRWAGGHLFRWSPTFAELVFRTAGGQQAAAAAALEHGIAFNLASGAHHAEYAMGGGFCTFNYLVTAPRALMNSGRIGRVLILDFDEHQGNGTWEITRNDPRFFCYDISGTYFGVPPHEDVDGIYVLLDEEDAPGSYAVALERLPKIIEAVQPELIQYQAGMDSWERDPLSACRGITASFLAERDRTVFEVVKAAQIPLVVNLAGGYVADGNPNTAALHVSTLQVAHEVYRNNG